MNDIKLTENWTDKELMEDATILINNTVGVLDPKADKLNEEYEKEEYKPKYIEVIYEAAITFDLDELLIDWDDVSDYWVKWGTLHVKFNDGSLREYDGDIGDPDYKWGIAQHILDRDYNLLGDYN